MNLVTILWVLAGLFGLAGLFLLIGYLRWRAQQQEEQSEEEQQPKALLEDLEESEEPTQEEPTQYEIFLRPVVIGRAMGEDPEFDYIVLDSKTVSRKHAIIEYLDYNLWVIDQGSANGTFLNEKRITGRVGLKNGDTLRLHKYQLRVLLPETSEDSDKTMLAGEEEVEEAAKTIDGDATERMPDSLIAESRELEAVVAEAPKSAPKPAPEKISLDKFMDDDNFS